MKKAGLTQPHFLFSVIGVLWLSWIFTIDEYYGMAAYEYVIDRRPHEGLYVVDLASINALVLFPLSMILTSIGYHFSYRVVATLSFCIGILSIGTEAVTRDIIPYGIDKLSFYGSPPVTVVVKVVVQHKGKSYEFFDREARQYFDKPMSDTPSAPIVKDERGRNLNDSTTVFRINGETFTTEKLNDSNSSYLKLVIIKDALGQVVPDMKILESRAIAVIPGDFSNHGISNASALGSN